MNLVLVESPTKARMLSKFLGGGYQVEATMGHIRDLPQKKFGVDIKVNGQVKIVPEYQISEGKVQRVTTLKSLSQKTEKIILATDPDRLPPQARLLIQPPGFFRTSPADHHLDAFFAAVLARS